MAEMPSWRFLLPVYVGIRGICLPLASCLHIMEQSLHEGQLFTCLGSSLHFESFEIFYWSCRLPVSKLSLRCYPYVVLWWKVLLVVGFLGRCLVFGSFSYSAPTLKVVEPCVFLELVHFSYSDRFSLALPDFAYVLPCNIRSVSVFCGFTGWYCFRYYFVSSFSIYPITSYGWCFWIGYLLLIIIPFLLCKCGLTSTVSLFCVLNWAFMYVITYFFRLCSFQSPYLFFAILLRFYIVSLVHVLTSFHFSLFVLYAAPPSLCTSDGIRLLWMLHRHLWEKKTFGKGRSYFSHI